MISNNLIIKYYLQVQKSLKSDISKYLEDRKQKKTNIFFFGPVESGKSSLINSYFSIAQNRISQRAAAGSDDTSFTLSVNFHFL